MRAWLALATVRALFGKGAATLAINRSLMTKEPSVCRTSLHFGKVHCTDQNQHTRSLVESVCKHVLEESGEQFNDWDNIYRQTSQLLNLAPDQQSEQSFRQLSGACNSIVGSLNEIRNRFGDAHGRGSSDAVPSARHAELAVNVAASLAIFIIRTRNEENQY